MRLVYNLMWPLELLLSQSEHKDSCTCLRWHPLVSGSGGRSYSHQREFKTKREIGICIVNLAGLQCWVYPPFACSLSLRNKHDMALSILPYTWGPWVNQRHRTHPENNHLTTINISSAKGSSVEPNWITGDPTWAREHRPNERPCTLPLNTHVLVDFSTLMPGRPGAEEWTWSRTREPWQKCTTF